MRPSELESSSPMWQLRLNWGVSAAQLAIAAAIMMPVYGRFFTHWKTHHPIVQASLTLVLPDVLMVRRNTRARRRGEANLVVGWGSMCLLVVCRC